MSSEKFSMSSFLSEKKASHNSKQSNSGPMFIIGCFFSFVEHMLKLFMFLHKTAAYMNRYTGHNGKKHTTNGQCYCVHLTAL